MSSRVQNLLMILGIVLIAGLGYYLYIQEGSTELATGPGANRTQIALESAVILQRLNEIKQISLEADLFTNPQFQALVDFTEPIIPQPVGRPNPFAAQ